jgi:hypothetical protein
MKFLGILGSSKASRASDKTVAKEVWCCGPISEDSITERTFSSDEDSSSALSLFGASAEFFSPQPMQKINSEDKVYVQGIPAPPSEDSKCSTKDCANAGEEEEETAPTTTAIFDGGTTGEENSRKDAADQYGYGDDSPTQDISKYEYDEAPPTPKTRRSTPIITHAVPRRSSLKMGGLPRRASIQFGGGEETQVYLPCHRQTVQKRNSITFNESVYVRNVAPISSLTDEPEALWIQNDEYREMKQKMKRLANLVDTGSTGGRNYCVRGLEGLMKSNAQPRMNTKDQAWDSVLDEQCRQEDQEIFDDETLANSYKLTSIGTKMVAAQRAKEDELAIEEYTRSTRLMMRRLSM